MAADVADPKRARADFDRLAVFAREDFPATSEKVLDREGQSHGPGGVFQGGVCAQRADVKAGVGAERLVTYFGRGQVAFVVGGGAQRQPPVSLDAVAASYQVVVVNVFSEVATARRILFHLSHAHGPETARQRAVVAERHRGPDDLERRVGRRINPMIERELEVGQLGEGRGVRSQRVEARVECRAVAQRRAAGVGEVHSFGVGKARGRKAAY